MQDDKGNYLRYLSWLAPLLVTTVIVVYNLMYAVKAVSKIESELEQHIIRIRNIEQAQREAEKSNHVHYTELKIKLNHVGHLCCSEIDQKE